MSEAVEGPASPSAKMSAELVDQPAAHCQSNRVGALIDALAERGYALAEDYLPRELVSALAAEALRRDREGAARRGEIGRADGAAVASHIREVRTSWLDGGSDAERRFLVEAEQLRLELNRHLMLGLFELEAQFLVYDAGGFYARHLDSFKGARNRVVSLVAYLNDAEWSEADGGGLLIWTHDQALGDEPVAKVMPRGGTIVLMLSEEIPHQVEPAGRQRVAIAGWWRVNQSMGGRVDPPA